MPENKKNKVEFGLRNVHYAIANETSDGVITLETPIPIPGSVTLTLDPSGDFVRFKADDVDYYTNDNNQGYEGALTVALVPESFKTDVLGEIKTDDGVMLESADAQTKRFALLYEFQGDKKATRHVSYYCSAKRPAIGSTTKDGGDPNTSELSLISSPRPDNNLVKAKTTMEVNANAYNNWFKTVYEPPQEIETP